MLKNAVPIYKIIREYHIRKERVDDIWDNCERLQQGVNYLESKSAYVADLSEKGCESKTRETKSRVSLSSPSFTSLTSKSRCTSILTPRMEISKTSGDKEVSQKRNIPFIPPSKTETIVILGDKASCSADRVDQVSRSEEDSASKLYDLYKRDRIETEKSLYETEHMRQSSKAMFSSPN